MATTPGNQPADLLRCPAVSQLSAAQPANQGSHSPLAGDCLFAGLPTAGGWCWGKQCQRGDGCRDLLSTQTHDTLPGYSDYELQSASGAYPVGKEVIQRQEGFVNGVELRVERRGVLFMEALIAIRMKGKTAMQLPVLHHACE